MKIVSKDFCTLAGVYMGPCRRSCIVLVWKFRTSKMLDKWSPSSKLPHIKLSHYQDSQYFFSLARDATCPPYLLNLFFDIFKSFTFEYLVTCQLCWFGCKCVTIYVSENFSKVLEDRYFSWLCLNFIDWIFGRFFPSVFSPWPKKKKDTWKSCSTKFSPYSHSIYSFKGKCNFCNRDNCFRKIKWLNWTDMFGRLSLGYFFCETVFLDLILDFLFFNDDIFLWNFE